MPSINVPAAVAAVTVNGTTTGYITVADNTPFYPRARVWMRNTDDTPVEYIITNLSGTTLIGLQAVQTSADPLLGRYMTGNANYTRSDCSAWTVAKASMIFQDRQTVAVENSTMSVKLPLI